MLGKLLKKTTSLLTRISRWFKSIKLNGKLKIAIGAGLLVVMLGGSLAAYGLSQKPEVTVAPEQAQQAKLGTETSAGVTEEPVKQETTTESTSSNSNAGQESQKPVAQAEDGVLLLSPSTISLSEDSHSIDINATTSDGASITAPHAAAPFYPSSKISDYKLYGTTQTFFIDGFGTDSGTYKVKLTSNSTNGKYYSGYVTVNFTAKPKFKIGSIEKHLDGLIIHMAYDPGYVFHSAIEVYIENPPAGTTCPQAVGVTTSIDGDLTWVCHDTGPYTLKITAKDAYGAKSSMTTTWLYQP